MHQAKLLAGPRNSAEAKTSSKEGNFRLLGFDLSIVPGASGKRQTRLIL